MAGGATIKIERPRGEFLSVRKEEYRGQRRVDTRNFYHDNNGEERHGKGTSVYTQEELDKVVGQLQRFRDHLPAD